MQTDNISNAYRPFFPHYDECNCLEAEWRFLDCDKCDVCEIRICVECGKEVE